MQAPKCCECTDSTTCEAETQPLQCPSCQMWGIKVSLTLPRPSSFITSPRSLLVPQTEAPLLPATLSGVSPTVLRGIGLRTYKSLPPAQTHSVAAAHKSHSPGKPARQGKEAEAALDTFLRGPVVNEFLHSQCDALEVPRTQSDPCVCIKQMLQQSKPGTANFGRE